MAKQSPKDQKGASSRPVISVKSLKDKYQEDVLSQLQKELGLTNIFEVPKFEKVVINVGLGDGSQNAKLMEAGLDELTRIAGQKAVITRATKSIAGFKVRENMPVGARVTLRGDRMYNFLSKLINVALPRIRDFRGVSEKSFDGRGNYNLGLKDQLCFPEIQYDKVARVRGMNITIVTTAKNDMQAQALLKHMGMPFRKLTASTAKPAEAEAKTA